MAGIRINIDASGAKTGAAEVSKALTQMAESAARSVRETDAVSSALTQMGESATQTGLSLEQIRASLKRQQEAQTAARTATLQEISLLQQKIAIQKQVQSGILSVADATRKMAEAENFAKTGSRALAQQLAATRAEYEKNARAMQEVGTQTQSSILSLGNLKASLIATAASFVSFNAAAKFIEMAEEVNALRIQVAALPTVGDQAGRVFERLVESAKELGVPLKGAVETFTLLSFGAQAFGASTADILKVVETLQKVGAVNQVNAEAMQRSLLQLGQVFAQGKFQADELNVILTQTPAILNAIAAGAEKDSAELVNLARTGKFSVLDTFQAILKVSEDVNEQFENIPPTVSRAVNEATITIGEAVDALNQKLKITENIAKGIIEFTRQAAVALNLESETEKLRRFQKLLRELEADQAAQKEGGFAGWMATFERGGPAQLQASIDDVNKSIATQQAIIKTLDQGLVQVTGTTNAKFTPAQLAAAEQVRKHNERLKEQGETLNLTGDALARYHQAAVLKETGDKALADETYKLVLALEKAKAAKEADAKATQAQAEADRKAQKAKEDFTQDVIEANLRVNKMNVELAAIRAKEDKAEEERLQATRLRLQALQNELLAVQEEGQLINASLGPKAALRELELSIAKARIDRQVATDLTAKSEIALTDAEKAAIKATGEMAKANLDAAAAQQKQADAVANAVLSTADLKTISQSLLQGTQGDFGDIFEDLGKTAGLRLVDGIMFGKGQNEQAIIGNFNQLLGVDAAGLFGAQGANLGQTLMSSLLGPMQTAGTNAGDFFGVAAADSATDAFAGSIQWEQAAANGAPQAAAGGSLLGDIFGSAMAGAAGMALGKGISSMLGVGGSKSGKLGSTIGGGVGAVAGGVGFAMMGLPPQLGAALGGAVGSIFGGFIGDLFASTPSKGTQIRSSIKKFLKEIEVSFADEIDKGDYFFGATKKLANKLFGGDGGEDFLKASKIILNDKIGPELAKQLQALGTFITADQAKKLGKSVEQTGTTFGNLLLDNLGLDPEKIQGAIDEIIDKAGISFPALAEKLTSLFEEGEISTEFYTDAIMGAVDIFFNDFPAAIQVSKVAMEAFTEEGILDLETFQKKMEELTTVFDTVVNSFIDVVVNGKPGEDIGALLGQQIAKGLEDAAVAAFLTKFINEQLFEGIDITDGLNAEELEKIEQRAGEARIEVEKLWDAFGGVGKEIEETEDKAEDLFATLQSLFNQRFDLRLNVMSDLEAIGAISGVDAARARVGAFAGQVSRFSNQSGGLGSSDLSGVSDLELEAGIEAIRQARQAQVDLFQAQEQAAQDALAQRVRDINDEYDARRTALQKEAQAAADASAARLDALAEERDATQELYNARLDGLREELRIAQAFQQTAENLQQTINQLVSSSSRFSGAEQLALAERQAADLRSRIAGASGEEQARLIEELANVLQTQLGVAEDVLGEAAFRQMFDAVVLELEGLRDESAIKGDQTEAIQQEIAATTAQMDAALKSIDGAIKAEQAAAQARQRAVQEQAERLSEEEQAAVEAAEAATSAEIAQLRLVAAEEIRRLAVIEDQMLVEQIARAQEEVALSEAQFAVLSTINTSLINIDANIGAMLENIAATGGAEGGLAGTTTGNGQSQGVNFNPSIAISVTQNGSTEVDGQSLGRAVAQAVLYEWHNGQLGREIRQEIARN